MEQEVQQVQMEVEKLGNWFGAINLTRMILSIVIIVLAAVLWRIFRKGFKRYIARRAEVKNVKGAPAAGTSVVYGVVKGLVILGVFLIVMQVNNVNVSALVAGLGIASAIVGLAFQDLLRDIIMGLHVVSDGFFEVGDVIRYGDVDGLVISFNIRTTKIKDIDNGNILTICNRNITEAIKLSNLLLMNVPLSYEEDYRKVHRVLTEAARRIGEVEQVERCEYMGTQDFKDSSIFYRLHIYAPPEKKWIVWRAARSILQELLEAEGITIPYQQIDIHVKEVGQIGLSRKEEQAI